MTESGMELLKRDFALHCLRLRKALGVNQSEFARLLGIKNKQGKITVSRWESGGVVPYEKYLKRFLQLQNSHDGGNK